jgi:hypothetical protein
MWTISGSGSVSRDTVNVEEGKYSAKVDARFGRVDIKQTVNGVVPGKHYKISFRYYRDAILMGYGIRFWSNFCKGAAPIAADSILQPSGYLKGAEEAWTQFAVEDYVAPDSADSFNFEVRTYTNSVVYFDDFCFTDAAPPSIGVSSDALSFSAAAGGFDSQTIRVSVINIPAPLTVSISGNDAALFTTLPLSAGGAAQALTIVYAPDNEGSHSATLAIAGDNILREVALCGTATAGNDPYITITPISSICTGADTSPYCGQRVTIAGVVTAITRTKSFFVQSGSGAGSGLYAHLRGNLVRTGDSVIVTGWIGERNNLTEITVNHDADIVIASDGNRLPPPTAITISQMSKAYHGVLLCIDSVEVSAHATDGDKYVVGRGDSALQVAQEIAATRPAAGATVNITGVGFCDGVHQLLPRSASDLKVVIDAPPVTDVRKPVEHVDASVYPNPSNDLLYVKAAYTVAKIEVYSIAGTMLLKKELANSMSIASLKSGDYLVRVTFANGTWLAKVIAKK